MIAIGHHFGLCLPWTTAKIWCLIWRKIRSQSVKKSVFHVRKNGNNCEYINSKGGENYGVTTSLSFCNGVYFDPELEVFWSACQLHEMKQSWNNLDKCNVSNKKFDCFCFWSGGWSKSWNILGWKCRTKKTDRRHKIVCHW